MLDRLPVHSNLEAVLKRPHLTPLSLALAVALSAPAWSADSTADKPDALERVVVTGSLIKRTAKETALPLLTLSKDDIAAMGAMNVGEILANLTSNDGSAISDLGGANSWASGASSVSLRNLGTGGTLVLVNGRRVSSYGFADGLQLNFTNIDSIPSQILERVEVLKDGASAIYGSDAIGGVVNLITKKDFHGVALAASGTQSLRRGFLNNEKLASVTVGTGTLDGQGYNVYAHVELFKRGNYKDSEVRGLLPAWYLEQNPARGQLSSGSFPGNFVGRYPNDPKYGSLAGARINQAAPGCAPENLSGGLCWYDYWKDSDALPGTERVTALAGARWRLNPDTTVFAELHGADIKAKYYTSVPRSNVTGGDLTWYDSLKGQIQHFTDPQLPVGHPNNPFDFPIGLNYRFNDHPEMFKNVGASKQYRALVGIEGSAWGWDYDTAIGSMGSNASQHQRLARDRYGYAEAITSGEYKFGQVNPQSVLDKMFPDYGSSGHFAQQFADLRASRELMQLPAGPLQIAVGAELRHENFWHRSSDNVLAARIVQFSGVSLQGSRDLGALFTEVEAPLHKTLRATVALRGDKVFDGFGALTPKFALAWRPDDALLVRGTVSRGFRAPSLPETGNGGASWFNNGYVDPKRCDMARQMETILKTGNAADKDMANTARALGCTVSFPARVAPNPDLSPEHSENRSIGLVLQATKQISLALDYFHIVRKDEISTRDVDEILANEDRFPGLVERGAITPQERDIAQRVKELSGQTLGFAVGPISTIAAQYQNLYRSRVSGFDLDVRSRWSLGDWGWFDAGVEATYQIDLRRWDAANHRYTQNYVGWRGAPRLSAVGKLGWSVGPWRANARINHYSGTQLAWGELDSLNTVEGCADRGVEAGDCRIRATTSTDLSLSFSGIRNLTLSAHLFNAFNQQAPVQRRPGSSLPLWGRVGRLALEYQF